MFQPTDSIEKTVEELLEKHGKNARIAVMPLGPLTIPYIKDAVKS
jgi:hypothetical protein